MCVQKRALVVFALLILGYVLPALALATNGYFTHGFGTKSKGMAGAAAALPQDSLAAATNPAGMVLVDERWDAGGALFNPNRGYTYSGMSPFFANPSQESGEDQFLIPHFGIKWGIGGDQSLGVAVYGNGGMNTTYPQPVFAGGSGETGVDLTQLFVNVSYAVRTGPVLLGASAIFAHQRFEALGLQPFDNPFFSSKPGSVTNKGMDTSNGIGVRLGVLSEVGGGLSLGAAYQPELDMSEFSQYAGLFAEQGDFNIPSNYVVGLAWDSGGGLTLALDYGAINYSDVPAVSNPGPTMMPPYLPTQLLGGPDGFGFGWQDIDVIKLGAAYVLNPDWTLRAGYNTNDQPIPATETFFNILAPGVMEEHVTLGFTVQLGSDSELSLAYMRALEQKVSGPFPAMLGGGTNELRMDQNELEVSFGMKL